MFTKTITVRFTVQNEDDFFSSLEEGMISDQSGYSSYTALDCETEIPSDQIRSDQDQGSISLDDLSRPSEEVMQAVRDITDQIVSHCEKKIASFSRRDVINSVSHPWRILYGEILENEIFSNSFLNLEELIIDLEDSYTPYCILEFVEGSGWKCYSDFMEGEEIYYSSLFDSE